MSNLDALRPHGRCAGGQLLGSDSEGLGLDADLEDGLDSDSEGELDDELDPGTLPTGKADLLLGSDSEAGDDALLGGQGLSDGADGDLGLEGSDSEDDDESDEESGDEDALHAFERKARSLDQAR